MDDRDGPDLAPLAPTVHMPAARALFLRRRARSRQRRRIGAATLVALVLLSGVATWAATTSDGTDTIDAGLLDGSSRSTEPPIPTTSVPDPDAGGCRPTSGSSPATFDPDGGTYASYLSSFDVSTSTLRFDVVQWLSGREADDAHRRREPDDTGGAPGGYVVVNDSEVVRSAPVRADAVVRLVRLHTTGTAEVELATLDELPDYLSEAQPTDVFWITFVEGRVVAICEQYRP